MTSDVKVPLYVGGNDSRVPVELSFQHQIEEAASGFVLSNGLRKIGALTVAPVENDVNSLV